MLLKRKPRILDDARIETEALAADELAAGAELEKLAATAPPEGEAAPAPEKKKRGKAAAE